MRKRILTICAYNERLIIVIMSVLALLYPLVFNTPYLITIATMSGIYAILALSLNVMTGYTGVVTLGHAAFFGIGAYTSALLARNMGWNFVITFFAAMIISAFFGILLGLATLRLSGRYLTIVTLSFCEIVRIMLINLEWLTRGPLGITNIRRPEILGFSFRSPISYYYLVLVCIVFVLLIVKTLMNSRIGRGITALKNDEIAAMSMGIKVFQYKLIAFAFSSMIAGLGGALYAHFISFIDPFSFGFEQSILILSMSIIGGLGNQFGSIFGAVALIMIPEVLRPLMAVRLVLYGAALVLVVLFRPKGLFGGINLKHIRQQAGQK